MAIKNKNMRILKRLAIWILYLFAGFILYTKDSYLYSSLIIFSRIIYPLSIFWLQIRINKRAKWLPIDPSMSTSLLWFSILPVIASLLTLFLTSLNLFIFLINLII